MDSSWLQQPGRKAISTIAGELCDSAWREREVPYYYFAHALFHPGAGDYRRYVGRRTAWRLIRGAHELGRRHTPILKNKLLFEAFLREAGIPGPPAALLSVRDGRYHDHTTDRDLGEISVEDLRSRMEVALESAPDLFVKRTSAQGGSDASLIRRDLVGSGHRPESARTLDDIDDLHSQMTTGDWMIAPAVQQHANLAQVYPFSVNTVRVVTWKKPNAGVQRIAAFLRFGDNGSVVDNRKAGGILVPVELEGGRCSRWGFKNRHYRPMVYERHPHSQRAFFGLRCPRFDEAVRTCTRVHEQIDRAFVGWDVAIGPETVHLLEGNTNPSITMTQTAVGGLRSSSAEEAYSEWL